MTGPREPRGTALALRTMDRIMLGFSGLIILIAATRVATRPHAGWAIVAYLLIALLVVLLRQPGLGRLGRLLAEVYPILLLPALYLSLDLLNSPGARNWDPVIQRWEAALFGQQVSHTWWQASPSRFWSAVLHAVYLTYYLIVPLPLVMYLRRGDLRRARTTVTILLAVFLAHYICFLLFPVAGPYYEFPRPEGPFVDNWAARLVYGILSGGSSYGAAFPSSHVAATFAATLATGLGSRRLGAFLLLPTGLMAIGVVYTQMHYAVDALAGLAVAPPIVWLVVRAEAAAGALQPQGPR